MFDYEDLPLWLVFAISLALASAPDRRTRRSLSDSDTERLLRPERGATDGGKASTSRNGPAILAAQFKNDSGSREYDDLVRGFTQEVITGLMRFNNLFVFGPGPETSVRYGSHADVRGSRPGWMSTSC